MNADLGFSPAVYGMGASIFFAGYALFEVPSNLVLARVGARRWIARIMVTWGLLSVAMMFVQGQWSFYAVRFALGVAEAGFLPGILYYLSAWFPKAERARAVSWFMLGIPLSHRVRRAAGRHDSGARQCARPAGLAVAVRARGTAGSSAGCGYVAVASRQAHRCALAQRRRAAACDAACGRRSCGDTGAPRGQRQPAHGAAASHRVVC